MDAEREEMKADGQDKEGELPLENVTNILDTDVLCGRGGAALRHPGNVTYRTLVTLNKGLYITCIKSEKLKISKSIVAAIREQKGRFLEKNKSGSWNDIGDKKAIEKTSQALREGQPKLKQQIAELGGNAAAALMQQQQQQQFPSTTSRPQFPAQGSPRHTYSNSDGNLVEIASAAFAANDYSTYDTAAAPDQTTSSPFRTNQNSFGNNVHHDRARLLSVDLMPPPPAHQRPGGGLASHMGMSNIEEEPTDRMRPSMLKRGSIIAHELGIDPQSTRSLMSDFSNYGMSDDFGSLAGLDLMHHTSGSVAAALAENSHEKMDPSSSQATMDRRRFFAKMKFSRPASSGRMNISGRNLESNPSFGDGMPDIHFVGSNMSLFSTVSSIGDPADGNKATDAAAAGSRRPSLMSGLSRISDTEDSSIISDLSKKIGNVSTRSMAMSEISNIDDIDSIDTPEKQQASPPPPPQPMTSTRMELE